MNKHNFCRANLIVAICALTTGCASNPVATKHGDFTVEKAVRIGSALKLSVGPGGPTKDANDFLAWIPKEFRSVETRVNKYTSGVGWRLVVTREQPESRCYATLVDLHTSFLAGLSSPGYSQSINGMTVARYEFSPIGEGTIFWTGPCINGLASGNGLIVAIYSGTIFSSWNTRSAIVTAPVTMKDGLPFGQLVANFSSHDKEVGGRTQPMKQFSFRYVVGANSSITSLEADETKKRELADATSNNVYEKFSNVVAPIAATALEKAVENFATSTGSQTSSTAANSSSSATSVVGKGIRSISKLRELDTIPKRQGYDVHCTDGRAATLYSRDRTWFRLVRGPAGIAGDQVITSKASAVEDAASIYCQ